MITITLAAAQLAFYLAAGLLIVGLGVWHIRAWVLDKRDARFRRYHWSCDCTKAPVIS